MNRQVSVSMMFVLLACSVAVAQEIRYRDQTENERNRDRGYTSIRLVQNDAEKIPLPPTVVGLDDYNRVGPLPIDEEARARARASQPITLGAILDDDNQDDEFCEMQFCEQMWQCAGGKNLGCWGRWRRDFRRTCQVWGGGDGICIPVGICGFGFCGGCGCQSCSCQSCSCSSGAGCGGGCGSGSCTGPLTGGLGMRGARMVAHDPYVSALESKDPNTRVVGKVQILQDTIVR